MGTELRTPTYHHGLGVCRSSNSALQAPDCQVLTQSYSIQSINDPSPKLWSDA